jgi:SAM-dependent methyltransferase/polysaccharide pyruvyl transferase WcaK-like protein
VVTALLRRLFETGTIEAVLHAEPVAGAIGQPHVRAAISRSASACEDRRGSFYHPVCHGSVLPELLDGVTRAAIVAVPCVIRAIRSVWAADDRYRPIELVTVALACSHNVNGQFIDFLARSEGVRPGVPFRADLRNKDHVPDANNYNTQFLVPGAADRTTNRYHSLFTSAWRRHTFAMGACHVCADFWGSRADISVKDAWGDWARDPLGKSLVVIRAPRLEALLRDDPRVMLEPLDTEVAVRAQQATTEYKQVGVLDRLNSLPWSAANRRSGYLRHLVTATVSKGIYTRAGYLATRVLLAPLLGRCAVPEPVRLEARRATRLRRALRTVLNRYRPATVVCWGTGAMARDVVRAIGPRIDFFVDNDPTQHGGMCCGLPIRPPSALKDCGGGTLVLIASMHDEPILCQTASSGLDRGIGLVAVRPLSERAAAPLFARSKQAAAAGRRSVERVWRRVRGAVHAPRGPKRERKILIVGGYGFRNAGDEAQLSSTLHELGARFPGHRLKVLTPNLQQTQDLHACQVGEAPRLAFYDLDVSRLYALDTWWKKLVFLARASWLLVQARLVRAGLPVVGICARRATLLHDLATAELLVFCGGGYLTGRTLSRLWDGMFLIRMAHAMGTPAVLSGQTIGIWNSRFSRRLAKWGLERAAVIATRDADRSINALEDLRLRRPRVMATCDDALCMDGADAGAAHLAGAFAAAGFPRVPERGTYIALNAHYWGLASEEDRSHLRDQVVAILDRLAAEGAPPVVGVPMHRVDVETLEAIQRMRPDGRFRVLRCEDDFRVARTAIGRSGLCVAMKHHPLIFALGQRVPAISLARGDYYEHKNGGALGLVGLAACSVRLTDPDYLDRFTALYRQLTGASGDVAVRLGQALPRLAAARRAFFDAVGDVLAAAPVGTRGPAQPCSVPRHDRGQLRACVQSAAGGKLDLVVDLTGAGACACDEAALAEWLGEVRRRATGPVRATVCPGTGRDRHWWENQFFETGFRKHPASPIGEAADTPGPSASGVELVFEKIPDAAWAAYPPAQLRAERDLHMDMLREPGIRSWAHLARYGLAREHAGPGMVVLDAACGLGYGSAVLAMQTGASRVVGIDASAFATDYARANFASVLPNVEFRECDVTALSFIEDACVDLAVSFETMEHLISPEAFLREIRRVLKPGGLLVASVPNRWVDDQGKNPVPWHLHVYDCQQFQDQIGRYFTIEALRRQNAGGGWKRPQPASLTAIPAAIPSIEDERDAEWWIVTARRPASGG